MANDGKNDKDSTTPGPARQREERSIPLRKDDQGGGQFNEQNPLETQSLITITRNNEKPAGGDK